MVVAALRQRRIEAGIFEKGNRPAKPGGFCFVEVDRKSSILLDYLIGA
jgi:hypothetical protein